jgi:hypothetical protein
MRRTVFVVFALVLFFAAVASGKPVHPAKARAKAVPPAASHKSAQHQTAKHETAQQQSAKHQPTPRKSAQRPAAPAPKRAVGRSSARKAARPAAQPAAQPAARPSSRWLHARGNPGVISPRLSSRSRQTLQQTPQADEPDQPATAKPASLTRMRTAMPPPLRGSFESLARQNEKSEADGLERIENEDDLADRIAHKLLVPVPVSAALTINESLPETHRYCRPWTASFLSDLARAHAAQFHRPLYVSSAVRTVEYQKRLIGTNGNAAAAEGDIVSPHLTGATIDIAKQGLSRQEVAWMRARLLALQQAGKIDVEEEFQQSCFHISVYRSYVPTPTAATPAAPSTGGKRKVGQPPSKPLPADEPVTSAFQGQ